MHRSAPSAAPGMPSAQVTGQAPGQPRESVTRRALLGGTVAIGIGLITACTSDPEPSTSSTSATSAAEPDADAAVRNTVAADEAGIIALYDSVIAAYPALAADLSPLRDEHVAHAEAMDVPAATPTPPDAQSSQPRALAALIDAEQQAIAQRTSACEATTAADLARTVALIAASEAGHAEFLRGLT